LKNDSTKNQSTDHNLRHDENLLVKEGSNLKLKDLDPKYTAIFKDKEDAGDMLQNDIQRMTELQDILYASAKYSLLIVFQAMDAAGKDSTIKHVMSGINPQGCIVTSFKQPSHEELAHDYLWRINKHLPRRGMISIFNRSHYEEVLVTRVHPQYILAQNIPGIDSFDKIDKKFWLDRYESINNFEKHLAESGTVILKFFLHVSKEEQKKRFLKRIDEPEKNWKFSSSDVKEREYWDKYMEAYEDAINHTSKQHAPWYVIPADKKWFMRAAVGDIIVGTLESLKLSYPKVSPEELAELDKAKALLLNEVK
jgi:PPK2 family polyphosphate:nucleotide phosphotransferase